MLRALYFDQPRSRHELAGVTGLSQASVSTVVGELISDGVVVEAGQVARTAAGRGSCCGVNPAYAAVVGIDVGETHVLVEVFELTLQRRRRTATPVV
ncbi:hypothetical protein [Saccharothrix sp. ALI-22-I]|uniref:hypothetical protein n=1 Tax=Saccharothrix sp. ALI-22-I TaxID=1933778 RepID=UPI001EE6BDF1|nr:hypothetical protein [Saccharothrix sp. ALI-22-I]